ncbi:hypothetical protein CC79DRAFT_1336758, partial [Sarocladium strictum]
MHRLPVLAVLSWATLALGVLEMLQHEGSASDKYHTWHQVHPEFPIESEDFPGDYAYELEIAKQHHQWLLANHLDAAQGKYGTITVAVLWDPIKKQHLASTVPRESRRLRMLKDGREAAPLWASKVQQLNPKGDFEKYKTHAEDGCYFDYESTKGNETPKGQYPAGSMIASWGDKRSKPEHDSPAEYPPKPLAACSSHDRGKNPHCREMAQAL